MMISFSGYWLTRGRPHCLARWPSPWSLITCRRPSALARRIEHGLGRWRRLEIAKGDTVDVAHVVQPPPVVRRVIEIAQEARRVVRLHDVDRHVARGRALEEHHVA